MGPASRRYKHRCTDQAQTKPEEQGNGLRAGERKERVGRAGVEESCAGLLGWVGFGFSYFLFLSSFLFQTPPKSI